MPFGDVAGAAPPRSPSDTALVVLEPIQGENGVVVPPAGYLKAARAITAATGALLVLDEVQTGIGRTGHWFAYQAHEGVLPDVVTLAKGLGGGLPLGATVAFGRAADLLQPGQHGTTFGGNPVACAAGLAVLDTIDARGAAARTSSGRARGCGTESRRSATRWSTMSGARACCWVSCSPSRSRRRCSRRLRTPDSW